MNQREFYKLGMLVLVLLLAVTMTFACGSGSRPPRQAGPNRPAPSQPTSTKPPPTQPSLPNIDVVVVDIGVPSQVKRGQSFDFTITLKNNNLGGPSAEAANIEIRARPQDNSMDVPVASTQLRDLKPQSPQQRKVQGYAPPKSGLWTIYATLKPFGYVDTVNNTGAVYLTVN